MIGVLGGMGPLATLDFFQKVLLSTPVVTELDHVPLLIQSDPRLPSRPDAILAGGPSPLPDLMRARDRLIASGATALAMPCNTAHYWYADLAKDCPVPFLSILDACMDELPLVCAPGAKVGLLGTRATLATHLFDNRLVAQGYVPVLPSEEVLSQLVLPAIAGVKAGHTAEVAPLLERAVDILLSQGASAVILACTEIPVALDALASPLRQQCIDSTGALARHCVAWWGRPGA